MLDRGGAAARRQLALLSIAAFTSMTSMRICDPLLPALARDFTTTTGGAAQVISAYAIAYGVMQLVYGPLADRYGKFRVVSLAVLACAACNVAAALSPSLGALVAFRAAIGGTAAAVIPLTMAWIGDVVPYERRQEALARLLGATVIGMITGQWAGGFLADTMGWRSVFVALALLFAATGVLMRAQLRPQGGEAIVSHTTRPTASYGDQLRAVLEVPWARRVLALAFLEGAFAYSAFAFVPSYLHQRFGLAMTWAGAVLALYGIGGLVYSRLARRMLQRWGEAGLARGGGALLGLAFATFAVMPHWVFALPACLVGGLGFYMLHNTLQTHATQMTPRMRGTAVSLFACTLFLGQSLGIPCAGSVVDNGSAPAMFAVTAGALALLAWWFASRVHARAAAGAAIR